MKQAILTHAILALLITAPVSGERHRAWTQFGFTNWPTAGRTASLSRQTARCGRPRPSTALPPWTLSASGIWHGTARARSMRPPETTVGSTPSTRRETARCSLIRRRFPCTAWPWTERNALRRQRTGWHHLRDSPRWPAHRPSAHWQPLRLGFSPGRAGPSACGYR